MLKFRSVLIVVSFSILCLISYSADADLVRLKDGRVLKGKAKRVGNKLVITSTHGSIEINFKDVLHWDSESQDEREYERRLAKLDKTNADQFYRLGNWAKDKSLRIHARECFEKAVELNPEHIGARTTLDFVKYKNQWMRTSEMYRSQGLVKFAGQWMTPEQKSDRSRDLETIEALEKKLNKTRQDLRFSKDKRRYLERENTRHLRQGRILKAKNDSLIQFNRNLVSEAKVLSNRISSLARQNNLLAAQNNTLTCDNRVLADRVQNLESQLRKK